MHHQTCAIFIFLISRPISIFWWPLFRIRHQYQYSGILCFEFEIDINILVASVSSSISISIFWWPQFRIQYQYQYSDLLYFKFDIDIEINSWWFWFQYWFQYLILTNIGSISIRYRYFGQYLLSRNSAKWTNLSTNIILHAHFDTNILISSVSNSRSISIFLWSQFRIRYRYQYSGGLCFEFDININILVASVSNSISISIFWRPLFRNDIDTISIFWPFSRYQYQYPLRFEKYRTGLH